MFTKYSNFKYNTNNQFATVTITKTKLISFSLKGISFLKSVTSDVHLYYSSSLWHILPLGIPIISRSLNNLIIATQAQSALDKHNHTESLRLANEENARIRSRLLFESRQLHTDFTKNPHTITCGPMPDIKDIPNCS